MEYKILPFGNIWNDGIFNVPALLTDKYLKMASEYQLKAILYILRHNGKAESKDLAKALGQTEKDIDNLLEFWIAEGILSSGQADLTPVKSENAPAEKESAPVMKKTKESLAPPRFSPKDIVALLRENDELRFLLSEAQRVLGRSISHAEQEMLINMVNYYGLKPEVVLMILEFYRGEKEKGKSIGISYVTAMAKNWAEEGIDSIACAEEKLRDIEKSDRLWSEIVALTGIKHRRPTEKQREMVKSWYADFDIAMISLACDIMKENIPEPKLAYMNSILKKWKKESVTSPAQVQAKQAEFEKQKTQKKDNKLKSKPSYDLEKIKKESMDNTDI